VHWSGITDEQERVYSPLCNAAAPDRADHPINCVDHAMATRFCAARGARLPTEAEWEYAARGPDGRIYPWGDEAPSAKLLNGCGKECVAWGRSVREPLVALYADDDGFSQTAPVGSFPLGRSRFGLLDVAGNVWEWVADWYGSYTAEPKHDPAGPNGGEARVIRGGAWNGSDPSWLNPSYRYGQRPDALSHGIGFRCAASLPKATFTDSRRARDSL